MINIKDIWNIFNEAGKIEEYQKILDLIDGQFKLRERIEELKSENLELKNKLTLKDNLEFKNNAYYLKNGDGPFCQACQDNKDKLIRMLPINSFGNLYDCHICKNLVNITGREDPEFEMFPPTEY